MGLPAQIQRQIDEADALHKQLYTTEPPKPESEAEPDAAAAETDKETPAVTQEPPAAQEPQQKPEQSDEYARLEQRYKSLQGMWQSAEARLRLSDEKAAALAAEVAELKARLDKPAVPEQKTESLVTDKDAEAFGTDLIDLARRVATEQFGQREQQLLSHIKRLESALEQQGQKIGSVAQTQAQSAQDRFYSALDNGLAQWESIQATPECQTWLSSRVPGTPYTWNQALVSAAQEFDSARALEVFDTFLKAHPQMDPRVKPAPVSQGPKPELSRQVAPSKSGATAPTATGKKTYNLAEYEAGMRQVIQLGKQRNYDAATELENELTAAYSEGRVTP